MAKRKPASTPTPHEEQKLEITEASHGPPSVAQEFKYFTKLVKVKTRMLRIEFL